MSPCCNRRATSPALGLALGSVLFGLTPTVLSAAPSFSFKGSLGTVQTLLLNEASGIVASRQNAGVLWTHNDSSFPGSVFALSTNGTLLGRYTVYPPPASGDFEDIAIGPGPLPELQYVYLGDIGDNAAVRPSIRVFRFPEPSVYLEQAANPVTAYRFDAQEITLRYPDGSFNAEALLVDPRTGDLFIATKSLVLNTSRIYRASRAELDSGGPILLTFIREIPFAKPSGGDISPDGRLITLRRGNSAALWVRQPGQSAGDALGGSPIGIPVAGYPLESNGEAIGFHPTSLGYYTVSEGMNQPLFFFRRTDAGAPRQPVQLIGAGESWRYRDIGSDEGTAWRQPGFDDSAWASGQAPLGYGQGDERTTVSFGPNASTKYVTSYLRKTFNIGATATLNDLGLRLLFTDGVVVYLNGVEVFRKNLDADPSFDRLANGSNAGNQNDWFSAAIDARLLRVGTNTVAVELHRQFIDGFDLSFDMQWIQGAFDLSPNLNATDAKPPTMAFTAPAANAVVTDPLVTVRGTAADNVGVAGVAWAVNADAFQPATGGASWSAQVPLAVGTNLVQAVAYDAASNVSAIVSRKIIRLAASPLAVLVSGSGAVTPNLDGAYLIVGKSYALTAKPATRNLFAGWTGGIETNATRLQFVMQSNLMLQATFVTNPFVATKGVYRGLFEDTNQVSHGSSGALTLTLTESGTFSAGLRVGGSSASVSGKFGLDGTAVRQVRVQTTNLLTVSLALDLADGADRLNGAITGPGWSSSLLAFRAPIFSKTNPAPGAGRYTMFISGDTNLVGPPGHSVAALLVTTNGATTLSGTLADGTKLSQSGPVSRDGWWPFYVPLYRGKGSVLGWLLFTNDASDSLRARVNWIKPAVPADKLYPGGFTNIALAYGSTYSAAAMTNYLAAHPDACLSVSGLVPDIQTNCLALGPAYTLSGPGVKSLKLDLPTGIWTGTYTNPATGRALPAKFTMLLQSHAGFGHVLSTNLSAAVEQLPAP